MDTSCCGVFLAPDALFFLFFCLNLNIALINLPRYECIKFIFGDLVNIFSQFPQFLNRISPRWRAMS